MKLLLHEKSYDYLKKLVFWCDAPRAHVARCEDAPWEVTAMDQMICSSIVAAMNGDFKAFGAILERVVGKPVQSHEISNPEGESIFAGLSKEEFLRYGKEALKILEAGGDDDEGTKTKENPNEPNHTSNYEH